MRGLSALLWVSVGFFVGYVLGSLLVWLGGLATT